MRTFVLCFYVGVAAASAQDAVEPALRVAVERFYATQQAEDVTGYLALWSSTAERPAPGQLKFIFDSGDDAFSDLRILQVRNAGDRAVVRATVVRDRTAATLQPNGAPMRFHTVMNVALTFLREAGEWKIVKEGGAADALADALIEAGSIEERGRLLEAEPDLTGPALVSAVSRQADALAQKRLYGEAQKIYELALDLATRFEIPRLQADILQNIGNALYYQRDFPGALSAYRRRLTLERDAGNDAGLANALLGIGTIQYSQFEYADALVSYQEALEIHERLGDRTAVATTLVSTGNIQYVRGDYAGAIADYARSRDLFRKSGDNRGETRALEGLARSFSAQGNFSGALLAYSSLLEEARALNDRSLQGTALLSIGDVHFRMGNIESARSLFDQSRVHFESLKDMANAGRAWQAMARADLVASRFPAAEQEFVASQGACTRANDAECTTRGVVGVAFAQAAQEHFAPAILSYRKAVASFTTLGKREDAARAELGLSQALLGNRDYTAARTAAIHARDEGMALGRDDVVWRALVAEARALRRIPDQAEALRTATAAVEVVDRMGRAALDRPNEALASDTTAAYALLAVLQAESGDAAAAFTTIERRRVHALRGALAINEREIARGMTPAERARERQLASDVVTLRTQFDQVKALPKPDGVRLARLEQALDEAVQKRRAAWAELSARLPQLAVFRGLAPAATMQDATALLRGDRDVFVEFVIDDDDLLVAVLSRGPDGPQCRTYLSPIPRGALALRIARALEPDSLRSFNEWRARAADLVKAIPAPAWSALAGATRVEIVPDDVLWRVPFEALPVETGFLADRTTVGYAGSATSLVRIPPVTAVSEVERILIVGSPELPASTRDRVKVTAPGWTLPEADDGASEASAVAGAFDASAATTLVGGAATEAALRAHAAGASLLHIAAPFRMNGGSPLFSPVLLAADPQVPEPSADNDGIVDLREVMNLDLRARLATLSDGGGASRRDAAPAAEVVEWAWRVAGVPAIVLPRWATEATGAVPLLADLYARVRKGDSATEALSEARRVLRAREDTRAPYFWAAWMVVGR
jgi:tetratricopeptide (TPR) repeat protein/CHAT domain-containing protein